MPSVAEEAIQEIRRISAEYAAEVRRISSAGYRAPSERTKRAGYNRRYWTQRRYITAERRLRAQLDKLNKKTRNFYEKDLQNLYLAGARSVMDSYDLTDDDLKALAKMSDEGMIKVMTANELAKRDVDRWSQVAEGSSYKAQTKKHSVRGIVDSRGHRYSPETYRNMVLSADANRAFNFGALAAAQRAGHTKFLVSDGSGCGWTEHDDPQQANGMIVTLDQALSHPIAHPYCQRQFSPYTGPKKAGQTLQKVAKAAAKVAAGGAVAAVGGAVALRTSKTLQRRLTEIVAKSSPEFRDYRSRVVHVAVTLRREADEITDELRKEMDEWALGQRTELSARARQLIGVTKSAPRKVVGDTYDHIDEFDQLRLFGIRDLDLHDSIGGHVLSLVTGDGNASNVSWSLPRVFSSRRSIGATLAGSGRRASASVGRDARVALSQRLGDFAKIGVVKRGIDQHVTKFVNITPARMIRYRLSAVEHGIAHRLVMNPNGAMRAGFSIDPRTGYITPSLRWLPKGPLRIYTEVNRSAGFPQTGAIMGRDVRKALNPFSAKRAFKSGKSKKATALELQTTFEDVMRRGNTENNGFLRSGDFGPGQIKDQILVYDEDASKFLGLIGPNDRGPIIRRGRIPDALSIQDPDTGKRIRVDLLIKNGKFVKEYTTQKGRITSVTGVVRLIVRHNVRFNMRVNLNLRGLGLDSLSDIRHLRLRDIRAVDPRRHLRIRSFSLELKAFGYSIWEIGKILRLPWEDAQRIFRDARRLADHAVRKEIYDDIGRRIASRMGVESLSREDVIQYLRGAPGRIRESVGEIPDLIKDSVESLKRKYLDDPLAWVLGVPERMSRISKSLEIKYKRPNVIDMFDRDDPPETFFKGSSARTADDMAKILYLSPEEISEELGVSISEALQIQSRAYAYFGLSEFRQTGARLPEPFARFVGSSPVRSDVTSFMREPWIKEFFGRIEGVDNPLSYDDAMEFSPRARMVHRDLSAVASWFEDAFPDHPGVVFRIGPDMDIEYSAFWTLNDRIYLEKLEDLGLLPAGRSGSLLSEADGRPSIWLHQKMIFGWELPDNDWNPDRVNIMNDDAWAGLHTLVHELGHHAHMSILSDDVLEGIDDAIFRDLVDMFGSNPEFTMDRKISVRRMMPITEADKEEKIGHLRTIIVSFEMMDELPDTIKEIMSGNITTRLLSLDQAEEIEIFERKLRASMSKLPAKDRDGFMDLFRTNLQAIHTGMAEQQVLEPGGPITSLEEFIFFNGDALEKRLSTYGTSMGAEFVAEAWSQHWLKPGGADDPIGDIVMRNLLGGLNES